MKILLPEQESRAAQPKSQRNFSDEPGLRVSTDKCWGKKLANLFKCHPNLMICVCMERINVITKGTFKEIRRLRYDGNRRTN